MAEETFTVGDIHCGGCERTIQTLMGDIDGVEQVNADHRSNSVAVTYDEQRISRGSVVAALIDTGYTPKGA